MLKRDSLEWWFRVIVAIGLLGTVQLAGAPTLLADYRFTGDGADSSGNSPPIRYGGTSFTNNTLYLPAANAGASADITGFSYASFTVSLDFCPANYAPANHTILCGGPAYRWMCFKNYNGALELVLNNWALSYGFPGVVLETNRWHSLVCSVDLGLQTILTLVDGTHFQEIHLQGFQFNVVGTPSEPFDKTFLFADLSEASTFSGWVDNLRVHDQALNAEEIASLYQPRISVTRFDQTVLVHWSTGLTGYLLEATRGLEAANSWELVAQPPVEIGHENVVVAEASHGVRFYRLKRP